MGVVGWWEGADGNCPGGGGMGSNGGDDELKRGVVEWCDEVMHVAFWMLSASFFVLVLVLVSLDACGILFGRV